MLKCLRSSRPLFWIPRQQPLQQPQRKAALETNARWIPTRDEAQQRFVAAAPRQRQRTPAAAVDAVGVVGVVIAAP